MSKHKTVVKLSMAKILVNLQIGVTYNYNDLFNNLKWSRISAMKVWNEWLDKGYINYGTIIYKFWIEREGMAYFKMLIKENE